MTNTGTGDGAAAKVKLPISNSTLLSAGGAGATAAFGPQVVKPIVEWGCDILAWAAPGFPLPNTDGVWSIACILVGGLTIIPPLLFRPHRGERRASDRADDSAGG